MFESLISSCGWNRCGIVEFYTEPRVCRDGAARIVVDQPVSCDNWPFVSRRLSIPVQALLQALLQASGESAE